MSVSVLFDLTLKNCKLKFLSTPGYYLLLPSDTAFHWGRLDSFIYIYIHRVSHEIRSLLRESVPYVKIYQYNPKHLCPKLNGYGDNGKRKVWTSWGCTHYTCQLAIIYVHPCVGCHVTECTVSHVSQASHVTSAFGIPVSCIVLWTLRITMTRVWMFLYFNLMACHSQVSLMLILTLQKPHIPASFNMNLAISKCVTAAILWKFSCHYLRNRSTLDIGVWGCIGIF